MRFGFQASNNEAKYEALLVGLILAKELKVCHMRVYSDAQLVVYQVNETYRAKEENMVAYLKKAKDLIRSFPSFTIEVILRSKNSYADTLVKLAFTKNAKLLNAISVKFLSEPNINQRPTVIELEREPLWMDPILAYLKTSKLPEDKTKARILRVRVAHYVIYNDKLYRKGNSMSSLRGVTLSEAYYIMREIHEGICENHVGG